MAPLANGGDENNKDENDFFDPLGEWYMRST